MSCLNVTFVVSGVLGDVDLAAQHVMIEVGTIIYMVWFISCVHLNIYGNTVV